MFKVITICALHIALMIIQYSETKPHVYIHLNKIICTYWVGCVKQNNSLQEHLAT